MSTNRFTRLFGATTLERKFRLLLSLFLMAVIGSACWWVSTVFERLAFDAARSKARGLVDAHLLEYHFHAWEQDPELKNVVSQTCQDLQSQDYEARLLVLEDTENENLFKPEDPQEEDILLRLQDCLRQQFVNEAGSEESSKDTDQVFALSDAIDFLPVFEERRLSLEGDTRDGEYHYYQPVYWVRNCQNCHRPLSEMSNVEDISSRRAPHEELPFQVVKISFRDNKTRHTIAFARANLLAGGLVTVFVMLTGTFILFRLAVLTPFTRTPNKSGAIPANGSEVP